ncbi:MAG: hypothetical protein OHK0012_10790 [Synechococcales cyanobacterium]
MRIRLEVPNFPAQSFTLTGGTNPVGFRRTGLNPATDYEVAELQSALISLSGIRSFSIGNQLGSTCVLIQSLTDSTGVARSTTCPGDDPTPTPTPTPTGTPTPTPTPTSLEPTITLNVTPNPISVGQQLTLAINATTPNGLRGGDAFRVVLTSPLGANQTAFYSASQVGCRAGNITCNPSVRFRIPPGTLAGQYSVEVTVFDQSSPVRSASARQEVQVN